MSRGEPSPGGRRPAAAQSPRAVGLALGLRAASFFLAGFLFGRASLFDALAPFGPALAAACDWAWGLGPATVALAGASVGAGLARGWAGALECGLLSLTALAYARARGAAPRGSLFWGLSLTSAGIVLGAPFAALATPGSAWAATLVQAALVPVLAALLVPFLAELDLRPASQRAGEPGEGVRAGRGDPLAASLGLAVGAAVAVAGLGGLRLGPLELRGALAAFITLLSASRRGSGAGAAVGTSLGLASFLFGAGGPGVVAAWGFGGLLAGAFAPWGRWAAAAGFTLGAGLAFLPTPLGELPDPAVGLGMLTGALAFAALPGRAAEALSAALGAPCAGEPGRETGGLGARSDSLGRGLAAGPTAPSARTAGGWRSPPRPDGRARGAPVLRVLQGGRRSGRGHESAPVGEPAEPAGPERRPDRNEARGAAESVPPARLVLALRRLAEAFDPTPEERRLAHRARAKGSDAPPSPGEEGQLLALAEAVRDEVCPGCPAWDACWEKPEGRTGEALRLLLSQALRSGRIERRRLTGFWATGCHRPGEIAAAANFAILAVRRERRLEREAVAGRGLIAEQLRLAAEALEAWTAAQDGSAAASAGRAPSGGSAPSLALARAARAETAASAPPRARGAGLLQYQVGAAKRARPGRLVSGDTHLVKEVGDGLAVVLSDGMGAGSAAARESQAAVSLFESLVDAGMGCRAAVQAVNTALLLRASDESFATLDVFLLDRRSGRGSFLKVGGAPSYVVQGGRVTSLPGGGVPLGVLQEVRAETGGVALGPGDLVVLVSDGVWEARAGKDGADWVHGFLAAGWQLPAAELAERLVAAATGKGEGGTGGPGPSRARPHDDLTALVVRVLPRAPG